MIETKIKQIETIKIHILDSILDEYIETCIRAGINYQIRIGSLICNDLQQMQNLYSLDDGKNRKLHEFFPDLK